MLQEPGTADLTAWVDFDALKQAVQARELRVRVLGPITQGQFLLANGMDSRVDSLQQVRFDSPGHVTSACRAASHTATRVPSRH